MENKIETQKSPLKLSTQMRAILTILSVDSYLMRTVEPYINLNTETIHLGRWEYFKVIELPFRELYPYAKSCKVPIQILHFRKQTSLQLADSKALWRSLRDK